MPVARMEAFLLQQHCHRRDEPNFRDDQRLVAGCLAPGLLAPDRRCAALAAVVAFDAPGRGNGGPCRGPWPGAWLARPAGAALAGAGAPAHRGALPADRVADPRRRPRQPDLGACRRNTWWLRPDLPLGDRHPVRRARLVAHAGLPAAGTPAPGQDACLRARHGGRVGLPLFATARVVGPQPWLNPASRAKGPKLPRAFALASGLWENPPAGAAATACPALPELAGGSPGLTTRQQYAL